MPTKIPSAKDLVAEAKKSLEEKAFMRKKEYLTGLNSSINSVVDSFKGAVDATNAVFCKKGVKPDVIEPNFGNPLPVLFGGYGITLNGKELGIERLAFITELSITQDMEASSTCTFKVTDPNFYFIEDSIYVRETPIQVSITLAGVLDKKVFFDGYIAAIDIDFPSEGAPGLSVTCIDKTHEMTRVKYKRSWENVNSAQVVQQIAQEHGYKCYIQPDGEFPIQATIIQDDKTDIEFLEELAGNETTDLYVCFLNTTEKEGTILYYVKKGVLDKENYTPLGYRTSNVKSFMQPLPADSVNFDVVSFKPSINIETREEKTNSSGINADTKDVESSDYTPSEPVVESSGGSGESSEEPSYSAPSPSNDGEERDYISYE